MKHGFTLIELMVVVAVIAVLAVVALFGIRAAQAAARDTHRQQIVNGIRGGLQRYYASNSSYYGTADFAAMLAQLQTSRFVGTITDPGCGSGAKTYPNDDATGNVWRPCGAATNPVYYYETPGTSGGPCTGSLGSSFQLRLVKEGGGNSFFCAPQ
jgi:prepilin-type N-terminal cleavage/methylation domain-containing protein